VQNDPVPRPLLYCAGIADDELRLLGDVAGKRVVELGVSDELLAIALAERGARAIAIDPDPRRISVARDAAERAGVRVEFHEADIADLGFATSGSVDLAVCSGTLAATDDVPRLLRQVHRVLRAESPLVLAVRHPAAGLVTADGRGRYATPPSRTLAELYMALHRANFRVDAVAEPLLDERDRSPALLVLRARKIGR
jgi:SAM-dependent methyltransferase